MNVPESKANADAPAAKRITLSKMQAGQKGKIVEINGGYGMTQKLDALGIRVGKNITKVSEQWMRGPVIVRQNHTQVALGFGMASKVMVEIDLKNKI